VQRVNSTLSAYTHTHRDDQWAGHVNEDPRGVQRRELRFVQDPPDHSQHGFRGIGFGEKVFDHATGRFGPFAIGIQAER
jgi:hypothetical protein